MPTNNHAQDTLADLQGRIDTMIAKAGTLGVAIAKLDRTTRGVAERAIFARLSLAFGELVDRLQSTRLVPITKA